jgi:hypothetical protein
MRVRRLAFSGSSFVDAGALIEEARQRQKMHRKYIASSLLLLAAVISASIAIGIGNHNGSPNISTLQSHSSPSNPAAPIEVHSVITTLRIPGLLVPQVEKSEGRVAAGAGSIWAMTQVLKSKDDCPPSEVVQIGRQVGCFFSYVVRIDPKTDKVVAQIPYPGGWAITYGDGAVWLVSGNVLGYDYLLYEIDPATDHLERTITVPTSQILYGTGAYGQITVGNGDVYFTYYNENGPLIGEVNATTGKFITAFNTPTHCDGGIPAVAFGGLLWDGCGAINIASGSIKFNLKLPNNFSGYSGTLVGNNLWVAGNIGLTPEHSGPQGALIEIDTTNGHVTQEYKDGAVAVTSDGSHLWAAENYDVATSASLSSSWTTKSTSEFYGELSTAEIKTTTGQSSHRVAQPSLGGENYWVDIAATKGVIAIEDGMPSDSPSLLRRFGFQWGVMVASRSQLGFPA